MSRHTTSVRPNGLEPSRGNLPTRPSTRSRGCRWVQRCPDRPICAVFWTRWTY
jgi:hypothetical protein